MDAMVLEPLTARLTGGLVGVDGLLTAGLLTTGLLTTGLLTVGRAGAG